MQVKDLLPSLYENTLEMQAIADSEDTEFENHIQADIDKSFQNTFINKADSDGLTKLEKIYSIQSDSSETITFRRQRLYSRTISSLPYTERYLVSKLNTMLGEGNWSYTMSYNTYTLTINSLVPGRAWYIELLNFLDTILPCNISYSVVIYAASWDKVSDTFATWGDVKNMTWQELEDGQWS